MASDASSQHRLFASPDVGSAAYQEAPAQPERTASPPWSSWQDLSLQPQHEEAVTPDSPRSASDWEVVTADSASSIASTSRSGMNSDGTGLAKSAADVPQLHITLTPQGSSAVTLQLEAMVEAASPKHPNTAAQQEFQQQLRKAQDTMLPEFGSPRIAAQDGVPRPDTLTQLHADALPTSTHMSMTADLSDSSPEGSNVDVSAPEHYPTPAVASEKHDSEAEGLDEDDASVDTSAQYVTHAVASAKGSAANADIADEQNDSVGQASVMSDGSFVDLAADAMHSSFDAGADAHAVGALPVSEATPEAAEAEAECVDDRHAAAMELSAEAQEVLGLLEDCTSELQQDLQEQEVDEDAITAEADDRAEDAQEMQPEATSNFQKYSDWTTAAAASVRCRLSQVLSALQAWSSSAYNSLPALYRTTGEGVDGKAAVQRWDWLHFLLTGSLAVVSASLGYYVARERMLSKRLSVTNAELSKLLFKVINLQQSAQYSGRVPIIRHTSSVSALTTFPLTHLM